MRTTNIITEKIMREAYQWALGKIKGTAEPIEISLESDDLAERGTSCIVSVFYDQDSRKALLRRDWLDTMAVQFNFLTNYDEIKRATPRSAEFMETNGIKLFRQSEYVV